MDILGTEGLCHAQRPYTGSMSAGFERDMAVSVNWEPFLLNVLIVATRLFGGLYYSNNPALYSGTTQLGSLHSWTSSSHWISIRIVEVSSKALPEGQGRF